MKRLCVRLWSLVLVCLLALPVSAQYATTFVAVGLEDEALAQRVNTTLSGVLTAFNQAQKEEGKLDQLLAGLHVAPEAVKDILTLWNGCPFRCTDTKVVESCTTTADGQYQVRNIPLMMVPADPENGTWKKYQEGVFVFNEAGQVTDFHLALSADLYIKVMRTTDAVNDFVQRQLILEYVERFRNAYNLKDMNFLEQVYSDDALIITGKVITTVKSEITASGLSNKKVVYSRQSKREYLDKLARIFRTNKRINVLFDDIKVMKHPAKPNFYGVTLKQGYESDRYRDEGYLFLLWDFTNPDAPQIHVRTWQPDKIDIDTPLPEEEVFSIDDFDI